MGADQVIHYLISDRHVSPPEYVRDYSERLVLMPHCYQVNYYEYQDMDIVKTKGEQILRGELSLWGETPKRPHPPGAQPGRVLLNCNSSEPKFTRATRQAWEQHGRVREIEGEGQPAVEDDGFRSEFFVFANFNKNDKIEPTMYDVWMNLLRQYPNSILWLLQPSANAAAATIRKNLVREAEARGILGSRLVFAPRVPKHAHLQRQAAADLFIDTFWYNAHSTGTDALRGGLPLLTCAGRAFPSRVAASLLNSAKGGSDEGSPRHPLITHSLKEFEDVGLRMAANKKIPRALRKEFDWGGRLPSAPLFDTGAYTASLERAFFMMWELFLNGPLMHIIVPSSP
jgi:predicted O-linked N-acetylglucosamine transferase (SPINDLY family)